MLTQLDEKLLYYTTNSHYLTLYISERTLELAHQNMDFTPALRLMCKHPESARYFIHEVVISDDS